MVRFAAPRILLAAAFLAVSIGVGAFFIKNPKISVKADELDNIYKQIDEKKEKLESIKNELNGILASKRSTGSKLTLLRKKEEELIKLSEQIETDYKQTSAEIDARKKQIDDKQQQLLVKQTVFYMSTQGGVVFLFGANSVNELMDRLTYITAYNQSATRQIENLQSEIEQLEVYKNDLKARKVQVQEEILNLRKKIAEVEAEYRRLQALAREKQAIKSQLIGEIRALSRRAKQILASKFNSNSQGSDQVSGGNNSSSSGGGAPINANDKTYTVVLHKAGEVITKAAPWPVTLRFVDPSFSTNKYFKIKAGSTYVGYFGELEFRKDTNVYVINKLPIEQYLYGLGEMPSSWPQEALKAQAIAGRTYAYSKYVRPRTSTYHIVDSVADQNYVGVSKILAAAGANWKQAVDQTNGKVLLSDGAPIVAYYHSTAGGHTLSSQERWGGYRSYAVAKSDRYQGNGGIWFNFDKESRRDYLVWGTAPIKDPDFFDIVNVAIYLQKYNGSVAAQDKIACCTSNYCSSRNTRCSSTQYDAQRLRDILGADALESRLKEITKVEVVYNDGSICNPAGINWSINPYVPWSTSHSTNAYCTSIGKDAKFSQTLRIYGKDHQDNNKTVEIPAQWFKMAYNIRSPRDNRIYGAKYALFDVQKHGDTYYIYSQSWGHRVGMSQYGAKGRAEAGQSAEQILTHYYNGVNLASNNWGNGPVLRVGLTKVGAGITTVTATHEFVVVDKNNNVILTVNPISGEYVDIIR